MNTEARSTGLGYCHGYKQPDEHYHDSWIEMQICKQTPYWHNGQAFSYENYVILRPHAEDGRARAAKQRWLQAHDVGAKTLKGGK